MSAPPSSESPRAIEVTTSPIVIGRSRHAAVRLLHPTVSGSHATLVRQGDTLLLEDSDSTFGTFVNGARVKKVAVRQGDRVIFGTQVAYRVQASGLTLDESPRGVRLIGRDVAIKVGEKVRVKDTDFEIPADGFVGMLGPSGVGKTTLLKCLGTMYLPGHGRIEFDDRRDSVEHEAELRAMLGYVPQKDAVFKNLTVRENLTYAAQLRFDQDRTATEVVGEVERVIQEVGLTDKADQLTESLSGGQCKRLSVAIELLKRPRLLLLDEPTSGLDPATECNLMAQFRHLANRGTTVICTTHLMENVRLFDLVIVFGRRDDCGQVAYIGPPDRLLEQFHCKTFADLYEKLEQGQFEPYRQPQSQTDAKPSLPTAPAPQAARPQTGSSDIATSELPSLKQLIVNLGVEASVVEQLPTLLNRSFRLVWRDPGLRATILIQPFGLGFLNCLSQYAALDTIALKFFFVVIAAWLGLNNSARDLVRERHLYLRERLAGLKPGAFLLSKSLVHVAIGAGQVLVLLCVLGIFKLTAQKSLVDALNKEPSFVWLFLVLMTVYTAALGLGLLVSALMRSEAAAVALLPLLIMPQLLIGAVGTGQAQEVFFPKTDAHVAFGPLVPAMRKIEKLPSSAKLAELASLACYSRPALLLLKPPNSSDGSASVLFADAVHLLLLTLTTWACTIFAFQWAEKRWVRLIDVD